MVRVDSPVDGAIALITVGVILLLAVSVFGTMMGGEERVSDRDDLVRPVTGEYVDVYDGESSFYEERGRNPTVRSSRNHSLRFTGAPDSYMEADSPINVASDRNWTIHQGVWVNSSATGENMTVLAVGDPDVILRYEGNRSTAKWAVVYYETTNTYRTTVDAPSPTDATQLFIERNDTTLTLYREDAANSSVELTGDSTIGTDLTGANNLDGRMDETRTFDDVLTSSERQALLTDPIKPLTGANRTARIMFDEGGGTTVNIFFAGATATASNATFAPGFDGHRLDRADLLGNGDYRWDNIGPELKLLSESEFAGAPALYAEYEHVSDAENPVVKGLTTAISLSSIWPVLLVLSMALGFLLKMRQR